MVSTRFLYILMGMTAIPGGTGIQAAEVDKGFDCPVPVTVTVTETVNKGSGEFHLTQPTLVVSNVVTPTGTKTIVKEVTDVITVVGPSTSLQVDSGTVKENGVVVTEWSTIYAHSPGSTLNVVTGPSSTSVDVTTTERSTSFTTDYVTLEGTTSAGSATRVPPKPHSSIVTVAPYGNATNSKTVHGSGASTLAAGTGNIPHTILSVTAPHPHKGHNVTVSTGGIGAISTEHHSVALTHTTPLSKSVTSLKGNGTLTITVPRPVHSYGSHSTTPVKHNETCTETETAHSHTVHTNMHSEFTSLVTRLSAQVNASHPTGHAMTHSGDGKLKAPVFVTVHAGTNDTRVKPLALSYPTDSSASPTLVTTGISSFPLSPLPSGVSPSADSSLAPLVTSVISSFPLASPPSGVTPATTSTLAPLVTTGGTPFSMAPLPPGVKPTTVNTTRAADPTVGIEKRSEPDMVYATIDGQLVSWSNRYTPSAVPVTDADTTWVFPTPVMPIPVSALESYKQATPGTAKASTSVTNSYGSFTLGPLPPTTTPRSGSAAPTKTSGAPEAFCSGTELGNVVIGFDDLPTYGEPKGKTIYPPLPERYHHLLWSDGFSYVPPPSDPFPPHSGHQLGVFIVDDKANVHSENGPSVVVSPGVMPQPDYANGMIGAGPNFGNNAYWFDVHNVYIGCYFTGEKHCKVAAYGWKYNQTTGHSDASAAQYFYLPMCQGIQKCSLRNIEFNDQFKNLTSFKLQATGLASNEPATYYLDDLEIQWSNDTCAANKIRNGDL